MLVKIIQLYAWNIFEPSFSILIHKFVSEIKCLIRISTFMFVIPLVWTFWVMVNSVSFPFCNSIIHLKLWNISLSLFIFVEKKELRWSQFIFHFPIFFCFDTFFGIRKHSHPTLAPTKATALLTSTHHMHSAYTNRKNALKQDEEKKEYGKWKYELNKN